MFTRGRLGAYLASLTIVATLAPGAAIAKQGGTDRDVFRPDGISQPLYAIGDAEHLYIPTTDGTKVYARLFRPEAKDGTEPPASIPTILWATPYASDLISGTAAGPFNPDLATTAGDMASGSPSEWSWWNALRDFYVERGYAFAWMHLAGTANSGGCFALGGPQEDDGILAAIEYFGTATWSNGRVGMLGGSASGVSQWQAATSGDPRADYVKAIVPIAPRGGLYEYLSIGDGVSITPNTYAIPALLPEYMRPLDATGEGTGTKSFECIATNNIESIQMGITGNYSPWFDDREWRRGIHNLDAAALMIHGLRDTDTYTFTTTVFDNLPSSAPHKLVLGQWGHATGEGHRGDIYEMTHAWFDRYLLNLPTRVEAWPDVQVMDPTGRWRAQKSWPSSGGEFGQLALGSNGTLSAIAPDGSTTFFETTQGTATDQGAPLTDAAIFTTDVLSETQALHITGVPVADLWVSIATPAEVGDAHIAVEMFVLDRDGNRIADQPPVFWSRSLQHLDPIPGSYFSQMSGSRIEENTPTHVPIRLLATDTIVPPGGRLRLRITGSMPYGPGHSALSGANASITVLHSCEFPSILRLEIPDPNDRVLDIVPPKESVPPRLENPIPKLLETFAPPSFPFEPQPSERLGEEYGGGLPLESVCDERPMDPLKAISGS